MDVENAANPDINRKMAVGDWQKLGVVDISMSQRVEDIANELALIGVKPMDALHVASAMRLKQSTF